MYPSLIEILFVACIGLSIGTIAGMTFNWIKRYHRRRKN